MWRIEHFVVRFCNLQGFASGGPNHALDKAVLNAPHFPTNSFLEWSAMFLYGVLRAGRCHHDHPYRKRPAHFDRGTRRQNGIVPLGMQPAGGIAEPCAVAVFNAADLRCGRLSGYPGNRSGVPFMFIIARWSARCTSTMARRQGGWAGEVSPSRCRAWGADGRGPVQKRTGRRRRRTHYGQMGSAR